MQCTHAQTGSGNSPQGQKVKRLVKNQKEGSTPWVLSIRLVSKTERFLLKLIVSCKIAFLHKSA